MRKLFPAAAVIAAGLAVAARATNAMPAATPGQLALAESGVAALEKTVLVCDTWTCYWRPNYWGYDRPSPYLALRRHYWWGWRRPWWGWGRPWGWQRW